MAKAHLSRLAGAAEGLSSERRYTLRTLPERVGRGIAEASTAGPRRPRPCGAILAGLGMTAAGYGLGRLRR